MEDYCACDMKLPSFSRPLLIQSDDIIILLYHIHECNIWVVLWLLSLLCYVISGVSLCSCYDWKLVDLKF